MLTGAIFGGCSEEKTPAPPAKSTPSVAAETKPPVAPPTTVNLPFKVEVVEVTPSTMPAIHSFASGTAGGKWLILGGRIAGLHGFGSGNDNFPRSTANTNAFVVDPVANKLLGSVDLVKNLPVPLAGALTATNPEFDQEGNDLFILGGYGKDLQSGNLITFGTVTKVDVAGLINAIVAGNNSIAGFFTQNPAPDNRLNVAGGTLKLYQNTFYLVFGQDFTGFYSIQNRDYNRAGGQFQKYTEKVRVFTLNPDLSINTFTQIDGGYDDTLPYHRRDLNVVDIIMPDGATPAATVYGGVFMAGKVAGHLTPMDVNFLTPPTVVRSPFKQGLNHYDCMHVTVFDKASSSSFTTLLGGISQFHYDQPSNTLVQDALDLDNGVDGLPFINTVSTIQHGPQGAYAQFIQPKPLPGLLGTDGQFLPDSALQKSQIFPNGVINLTGLTARTLVGHMVGGIESFGPYSGLVKDKNPATIASSRLFEIWITPGASPVIPMPPLPTSTTPWPVTK